MREEGPGRTDFASLYATMPDSQLVQIACEGELRDEALIAMRVELDKRAIGPEQLKQATRAREKEELRRVGRHGSSRQHRGTGMAFRGERYLNEEDRWNGIRLQTQWITLAWLGVVPLGSYRVKGRGRRVVIISRERLCWDQVLMQWAITFVVLAALVFFWQATGPHVGRVQGYR